MKKQFLYTLILFVLFYSFQLNISAQLMKDKEVFTHADTLRGSNNENRDWWDVIVYNIKVKPDFDKKEIEGRVIMTCKPIKKGNIFQVDLQQPLIVDQIDISKMTNLKKGKSKSVDIKIKKSTRTDNVIIIELTEYINLKEDFFITIYYHGKPREAITPPWDGGWIWKKDKLGRPWMSVACQGLGASVWYPCKDYQGDKPQIATLNIVYPDTLVAIGNGRINSFIEIDSLEKIATCSWSVWNPINNYNIIPYIGKYVNFTDTFMGEKGKLNLSYWVLDYNLEKAKEQFKQAKLMLRAFEYWFGPYPFYEDDYKLVEAPHLGMEHQSAIAYGNQFKNGYLGRDLSFSGWGNKWDYIIVHESGHEWFGNNITTKDIADMWVHEGFTTYSETLFTEYYYGQKAANEYNRGMRFNVLNNKNIIGTYGVNKEGSEDMYFKGSNMIHTIRHSLNNDTLFRAILRGLNKTFYHQTVTTQEIESYINKMSGMNFTPIFNQYLRTTNIPELEFTADTITNTLSYKWNNTVDSFNLRIVIQPSGKYLIPTNSLQSIHLTKEEIDWIINKGISKEFYIKEKSLKK